MNISFWLDDKEYALHFAMLNNHELHVSLGEKTFCVSYEFLGEGEVLLNIDGKIHPVVLRSNLTSHAVFVNGNSYKIEKKSSTQILKSGNFQSKKRDVKTSMPGKIIKILVKEGEDVEEGQAVLILEAMKMQNEIKSPRKGQIIRLVPRAGESVETGALLFSVE